MSKQKGDESAFGVATGSASVFVVADWVKDIIELQNQLHQPRL